MSALFNYSKIKDTVNFGGMLPGQNSRTHEIPVHYAGLIKANKGYVENGEVVGLHREISEGLSVLLAVDSKETEFASAQKGIVLADVRGQVERYAGPNFIYKHPTNTTVTVMTQGYVWVPVQDDGTIVAEAEVFVDANGGIVTTGGTKLTNAKFTGLYGYPLSSKQNGTEGSKLTGKTAEICLGANLI